LPTLSVHGRIDTGGWLAASLLYDGKLVGFGPGRPWPVLSTARSTHAGRDADRAQLAREGLAMPVPWRVATTASEDGRRPMIAFGVARHVARDHIRTLRRAPRGQVGGRSVPSPCLVVVRFHGERQPASQRGLVGGGRRVRGAAAGVTAGGGNTACCWLDAALGLGHGR
jgi:hypothetical protein